MSNAKIGDTLLLFTRREDALRERAVRAGLDLNVEPWSNWQLWIGDPERYLHDLKNTVEAAEASKGGGQ